MQNQFHTFLQLIKHELLLFKRNFFNKIIDVCIMFTTTTVVFNYFMATSNTKFGIFILIGAIASFGFFEVTGKVSMLSADIAGDRTVSYYLTLPMKSWLVFCAFALSWAIESSILALFLFPLGKLILQDRFNLGLISLKIIPMFIAINLFFGFFSILLVSVLKGLRSLSQLWVRILNPMYFFGCYFYPWSKAYSISKILGYIMLLNPFVYILEGMRAAALGQEGYLPFWLSFFGVIIFTFICGYMGITKLKRKLDYV